METAVASAAAAAADAQARDALVAAGGATSATHRSEYMAFLRAAKHPYLVDIS